MAWVVVYYLIVGSPEPQRGNFNNSHALLLLTSLGNYEEEQQKNIMEDKNQTNDPTTQQQQINEVDNKEQYPNQTNRQYIDVEVLNIVNSIHWFKTIGILTLINLALGLTRTPFVFVYGLFSTQVLNALEIELISIPYAILISIFFIYLSHSIKKTCNNKIYLCGIILLSIDITIYLLFTITIIFTGGNIIDILFLIFMCYALFNLCSGYKKLKSFKKENNIPYVNNKSSILTIIAGVFFMITETLVLILTYSIM